MALTTITVQPNSCPQQGSWSVVGAASAWQALSDGSTSTYVELPSGLCRLDSQVLRLGFPAITIPTGAQVYSVTVRREILSVVPPVQIPQCLHWFRSLVGTVAVSGQAPDVYKTFFNSPCPTSAVTGTWITETVYTATVGPDGQPWSLTGNLASGNFFYDMGRGDTYLNTPLIVGEVYLDVTYQQQSTVTVTGPTGTNAITRPTVTWTYNSADSQPQQGYQTALYTLAQVESAGFTPFVTTPMDGTGGFVLGEDLQWTTNVDLNNGQYSVYVQSEATWAGPGEFYSAIGLTSWTRNATQALNPPVNPVAGVPPATAVFSSVSFDAANNRVQLVFAPGSGGAVATSAFTVYASWDGSQPWVPIPSLTYVPAQGSNPVTVYDYVAPINVPSQYYVIAYGGSPLQAAASPSATLSITPTGSQHWLKHPSNPLLNTVLPVASPKQSEDGIKITKRRMQGTFQLLGSGGTQVLPFIVSGPTYGDEYQIELIFIKGDPNTPMTLWAPVNDLDNSGSTLLWQQPDGTQLWVVTGPGASGQDTQETYQPIPGDPTTVFWRRRKLTLSPVDTPSYF